jgi:hypothetical protein
MHGGANASPGPTSAKQMIAAVAYIPRFYAMAILTLSALCWSGSMAVLLSVLLRTLIARRFVGALR